LNIAAATAAASAAFEQAPNMVQIWHSDAVLLNTQLKLLYSEVSLLYQP
jgi:hypothetical protein